MAKTISDLGKSIVGSLGDDFAALEHTHEDYATTTQLTDVEEAINELSQELKDLTSDNIMISESANSHGRNLSEELLETWSWIQDVDTLAYENKTKIGESDLQTTNKTITGAINELFQSGVDVKQRLVDALNAKGANISTSDSWDTIIESLDNIASVSGTNIFAATALPATGNTNDICIVTNPLPNKIHIGRIKPTSYSTNDIWMDIDETSNTNRQFRTIEFGDLSTNLRVGTCYRLGSTETIVVSYYWSGSKWVVCSPTLINVKSTGSNSTGTISLGSNSRYSTVQSGGTSVTFAGYEGVEYTGTCTVRVYHSFNFGSSGNSFTYTINAFNAAGANVFTTTKTTTLGDDGYYYIHNVPIVPNGYVQVLASSAGANDEFNLYLHVSANKA